MDGSGGVEALVDQVGRSERDWAQIMGPTVQLYPGKHLSFTGLFLPLHESHILSFYACII